MTDNKVNIIITADNKTGGAFKGILSGLGDIARTASGFIIGDLMGDAIRSAAQAIPDMISKASDLNETISKTRQIFTEEWAGDLEDWANEWGAQLGQSKQQMLDGAASFGIFGKAAGLSGNDLVDFSVELAELSSDMASFSNTTPEDAMIALQAALRGETEPIRRYGVLLDDATLRQKALELGIVTTTKEALTPQQRVLAANAVIWEQTKDMQGDFQRTSGGLANQQRILTAEFTNLKTTLGSALMPVVATFMQMITTFVASEGFTTFIESAVVWLQQLAAWLGTNLPIAITAASAFWTGTLQPAIAAVWGWMSGVFIPFLQANVIPILQVVIPAAIQFLSNTWTNILWPALQAIYKFLFVDLMPIWKALGELIGVIIVTNVKELVLVWQTFLKPALEAIWGFIDKNILPVFKKWSDSIGGLSGAVQSVVGWLQNMKNMLLNIKLPDWLTPGSPTPFEIGLRGIADALSDINGVTMPMVFRGQNGQLAGMNISNTFNYRTNASNSNIMRDFRISQAMAG